MRHFYRWLLSLLKAAVHDGDNDARQITGLPELTPEEKEALSQKKRDVLGEAIQRYQKGPGAKEMGARQLAFLNDIPEYRAMSALSKSVEKAREKAWRKHGLKDRPTASSKSAAPVVRARPVQLRVIRN